MSTLQLASPPVSWPSLRQHWQAGRKKKLAIIAGRRSRFSSRWHVELCPAAARMLHGCQLPGHLVQVCMGLLEKADKCQQQADKLGRLPCCHLGQLCYAMDRAVHASQGQLDQTLCLAAVDGAFLPVGGLTWCSSCGCSVCASLWQPCRC